MPHGVPRGRPTAAGFAHLDDGEGQLNGVNGLVGLPEPKELPRSLPVLDRLLTTSGRGERGAWLGLREERRKPLPSRRPSNNHCHYSHTHRPLIHPSLGRGRGKKIPPFSWTAEN